MNAFPAHMHPAPLVQGLVRVDYATHIKEWNAVVARVAAFAETL